jgi:predicted enzyme related to lactoylglutathione lyase
VTRKLSLAVVTSRFHAMRAFYTAVLRTVPTGDDDYTEFRVADDWLLALCTLSSIEFAAPGAHHPGMNRCMRIELEVDDVDAEFERLHLFASECVTPPTDWPWGTRATWLRDPDGNLVSLFAPIRVLAS